MENYRWKCKWSSSPKGMESLIIKIEKFSFHSHEWNFFLPLSSYWLLAYDPTFPILSYVFVTISEKNKQNCRKGVNMYPENVCIWKAWFSHRILTLSNGHWGNFRRHIRRYMLTPVILENEIHEKSVCFYTDY